MDLETAGRWLLVLEAIALLAFAYVGWREYRLGVDVRGRLGAAIAMSLSVGAAILIGYGLSR